MDSAKIVCPSADRSSTLGKIKTNVRGAMMPNLLLLFRKMALQLPSAPGATSVSAQVPKNHSSASLSQLLSFPKLSNQLTAMSRKSFSTFIWSPNLNFCQRDFSHQKEKWWGELISIYLDMPMWYWRNFLKNLWWILPSDGKNWYQKCKKSEAWPTYSWVKPIFLDFSTMNPAK